MKRVNVLHLLLEVLVIVGNIAVGMTLLTYIFQGAYIDRLLIGSITVALSLIQICDYFTLKFAVRRHSLQRLIAGLAFAAIGIVFIFLDLTMDLVCILFGAFSIAISLVNLISNSTNLSRQPLLNTGKIIIRILTIVFSVFLIVKMEWFIYSYATFLGIALLVEASILIIEFIIHRYQL